MSAEPEKPIDNLPRKEAYAQLLAILTNRRKNAESILLIGLDEPSLREVLGVNLEELQNLLKEFNDYILGLGLTVVEYQYHGYVWYAIKSMYSSPIELDDQELAVLGTVIMFTEKQERQEVDFSEIIQYLTQREYFTEFKLRKVIQSLQMNGYLERHGKEITFGPRTLIEFSDEARTQIAQQTNELLF